MTELFDLDAARQRARDERPFKSDAGLGDSSAEAKKRRRKPSLVIPETLDGEQIEKFLLDLARKHPRRLKKALRAVNWLEHEGVKAGVW